MSRRAVLNWACEAVADGHLSLPAGEEVVVLNTDNAEWWRCVDSRGTEGWVPAAYAELMAEAPAADAGQQAAAAAAAAAEAEAKAAAQSRALEGGAQAEAEAGGQKLAQAAQAVELGLISQSEYDELEGRLRPRPAESKPVALSRLERLEQQAAQAQAPAAARSGGGSGRGSSGGGDGVPPGVDADTRQRILDARQVSTARARPLA